MLSNLGVARWLQSSWKLSRAFGVSNVAVLHRVSDLRSVGASDSEQVALAQGLLSDSETRVVYAQSPGELEAATELLSLSATETDLLPQLRRGIALVEGGTALVPGAAPPQRDGTPHRRHRRRHGRGNGVTASPRWSCRWRLGGALVAGISQAGGRGRGPRRRQAGAGCPLGPAARPAPAAGGGGRRPPGRLLLGCCPVWRARPAWRPRRRSRWSWSDPRRAGRPRAWPCRPSWGGRARSWPPA